MIDLHFNGLKDLANSPVIDCNFWKCPNDQAILNLRKYLFDRGVKIFLPTLITDSEEDITKQLQRIQDHLGSHYSSQEASWAKGLAQIAGVHIEGGYISRIGTHPQRYAEALGPESVENLAKRFPGLIKLWTICPRIDKDGKHVEMQRKYGITPSYGHSHANYDESMTAFKRYGVRLVTHWGNGMNIFDPEKLKFNRDEPSEQDLKALYEADPALGALGLAAFRHSEVYMMAICGSDGDKDRHISPRLIKELADTDRLILVTDAVAEPAGPASVTGASRGYELCGGQVSLDGHVQNGRRAGLTETQIARATRQNPLKILNLC